MPQVKTIVPIRFNAASWRISAATLPIRKRPAVASDAQVLEDAERLIAAWNERQAKRMPMLFSPTIGATIARGKKPDGGCWTFAIAKVWKPRPHRDARASRPPTRNTQPAETNHTTRLVNNLLPIIDAIWSWLAGDTQGANAIFKLTAALLGSDPILTSASVSPLILEFRLWHTQRAQDYSLRAKRLRSRRYPRAIVLLG